MRKTRLLTLDVWLHNLSFNSRRLILIYNFNSYSFLRKYNWLTTRILQMFDLLNFYGKNFELLKQQLWRCCCDCSSSIINCLTVISDNIVEILIIRSLVSVLLEHAQFNSIRNRRVSMRDSFTSATDLVAGENLRFFHGGVNIVTDSNIY